MKNIFPILICDQCRVLIFLNHLILVQLFCTIVFVHAKINEKKELTKVFMAFNVSFKLYQVVMHSRAFL